MMKRRKSAFLLPAGILVANVLNMAGIVVLPKIIDPDQFALFSLSSSIGLFLVAIFYEWSRVTTLRYSYASDLEETTRRRTILKRANGVTSSVLLALSAVFYAIGAGQFAAIVSMACLFAVSQALFENRQALLRADFRNAVYSLSLVFRAVLGFLLLCLTGYLTNDALYTMCGWAGSFWLVLACSFRLSVKQPQVEFDWSTFRFFVKFGAGAALAAMSTTLLPPVVRLVAAQSISLDENGKLMLAMDLSQKIVGVIGVGINIVTMQTTIRAQEMGDVSLVRRRIGMQMGVVFALILPAVAGFVAVQSDFSHFFVPVAYNDVFLMNISWCMAAAGLLGFRTFALDNIFVVLGRSYLGMAGPIATIIATLVFSMGLLALKGPSTIAFSQALFLGALTGVFVSAFVARRLCAFQIAWSSLARVLVATAAMIAAISFNPFEPPLIRLVGSVLAGGIVYGGMLVVLDAFDLRQHARVAAGRL